MRRIGLSNRFGQVSDWLGLSIRIDWRGLVVRSRGEMGCQMTGKGVTRVGLSNGLTRIALKRLVVKY